MYRATLFHPEGDFVTDFHKSESVSEVWESVNNIGSRWVFYPLVFVTTDLTVIDTPEGLEHFKGKRIKTLRRYLVETWNDNKDEICEVINEGLPLSLVYPNY